MIDAHKPTPFRPSALAVVAMIPASSFFDLFSSLNLGQPNTRQGASGDLPQTHVMDPSFVIFPSPVFPLLESGSGAFLHHSAFLHALSQLIMHNAPNAPRQKTSDLPELEVPMAAGSSSDGRGDGILITEHTNLNDLTPSQLYQLNQEMLDSSTSSSRPLIASVASLDVLREEYENGSQSFVKQIEYLQSQDFHGIRRTRGDGDCFYRSLAFAYIERIVNSPDPSFAATQALSTLEGALPMLEDAGFQKIVVEDFYEVMEGLIKRVVTPDSRGHYLTPNLLLEAFQDPETSNYVVVFLRLLTSAQIRTDPESFEPFLFHPDLGEPLSIRDFCEGFVEAVGKEADHVQVTALSRALKINVSVAYLDGRDQGGKVDFVEFFNAPEAGTEPLALLYRPGHYDILDKRSIEALPLNLS